jgi:hypothetical protein
MGEALLSGLLADASGKVGNVIYFRRNGKLKSRAWSKPTKPRTASQIACGIAWQALRLTWQTLTEAQRFSWKFAAQQIYFSNNIGTKFHPTAQQLYLKCNTNRKYAGLDYITDFKQPYGFYSLINPTASGNLIINFPTQSVDIGCTYLIYASKCLPLSYSNGKKYLRFVGIIPSLTMNGFDCTSLYTALFGEPIMNKKVFFCLKPVDVNSGLNGVSLEFSTILLTSYSSSIIKMFTYSY